ncbi:MAG: hypothetical protein EOO14_12015 [Chitinophagaceae bacterium]|nr:MAG: hypothetical protein EOO14_12015 [Chitinophagaceae bacterium]
MTPSHLDKETIAALGLTKSEESINASVAPDARIFQFPNIENVYIMESDLYGNPMPEGMIFLVFEGRAGLLGKQLSVERLRNSSEDEIRKIVEDNHNG